MPSRKALTKRLRVIRNAWHFYLSVTSVFKAQCRTFGIALLTPQRGVMHFLRK
ncbi:TPA: DUF3265 domain-containing protein [Vibrio campbellii]|nr:DUF3265 domain-containing protein [Vibrio campbellii]